MRTKDSISAQKIAEGLDNELAIFVSKISDILDAKPLDRKRLEKEQLPTYLAYRGLLHFIKHDMDNVFTCCVCGKRFSIKKDRRVRDLLTRFKESPDAITCGDKECSKSLMSEKAKKVWEERK